MSESFKLDDMHVKSYVTTHDKTLLIVAKRIAKDDIFLFGT